MLSEFYVIFSSLYLHYSYLHGRVIIISWPSLIHPLYFHLSFHNYRFHHCIATNWSHCCNIHLCIVTNWSYCCSLHGYIVAFLFYFLCEQNHCFSFYRWQWQYTYTLQFDFSYSWEMLKCNKRAANFLFINSTLFCSFLKGIRKLIHL